MAVKSKNKPAMRKLKAAVKRAKKTIQKQVTKPRNVQVTYVLKAEDNILPTLKLSNPCSIQIEICNNRVGLFIGPRGYQWAKTKYGWEHITSGTVVDELKTVGEVCGDPPSEQHEETVEQEIDRQSADDAYNEAVEAAGGEDKVTA